MQDNAAFIQVDTCDLDTKIKRMYVQDFADASGHKLGMSRRDAKALKVWDESATYVEHQGRTHLQLALPWVQGPRESVKLPPPERVEAMVRKRMSNLKRRLQKQPKLLEMCGKQLDAYKEAGHVRVIPPDERSPPPGSPFWMLPIVLAFHPRKPDEVRLCLDAAAQVDGVSLNSELLSGPDLMNSLLGVCLRFREYPVTVEADIEKMFHNVRLDPADCYAKCFYWWKNNKLDEELDIHQLLVQMFGHVGGDHHAVPHGLGGSR